jgi:hypothetical protein
MRSLEDNRGRELLNKWKRARASIQLSFNGVGGAISLTLVGVIAELSEKALTLEGESGTAFVDLNGAGFDKTVSEEALKESGMDGTQNEGTEIWLRTGDSCFFLNLGNLARSDKPN